MSRLPEPMRWFIMVGVETIHEVCIDIFGVGCGTISMYTGHFLEFAHGGYRHSMARLHRRNGVSEGQAARRLREGDPGEVYGYGGLFEGQ